MQVDEIEAKVLFSLYRGGYIGGQHTSVDNTCKGFRREGCGKIKKIIKNLIKERYLNPKPTSYGLHISINPKKIKEIKLIIKELEEELNSF